LALSGAVALALMAPSGAAQDKQEPAPPPTLQETRVALDKWIETQQIIARERNEWQQGKEILLGRLELVKSEVESLEQKLAEARTSAAQAEQKKAELRVENERLLATTSTLTQRAGGFEGQVRQLVEKSPAPVQEKLQPLVQRVPEDPAQARASLAERFQNVLGILNELSRVNAEISVHYEVRTLADGKPSEVRVLYVGLAQGYYVSAGGEAGIGRPGPNGWTWQPSQAVANDVLTALEILQGKHTPAFVPLPTQIQ
jgi:hypothetical protein